MATQTLKNWHTDKLGNLGRVVTGKTPSTSHEEYFGGDYPFITPSDIGAFDIRYLSETERTISENWASDNKKYILPRNAITYVCIGSTVGKIGLTEKESITNQQINSLIANPEKLIPKYGYYLLRNITPEIQQIASARGAGKGIINKTQFEDFDVVIPNIEDQKIIADVLSAYDDLIENNTRRIKILEQMAQVIYTEWFINFRFPGHEKIKMVDSGADFGKIPEGWEVLQVRDVIQRVSPGKLYDNETVSPNGKVPVLDQGRSGIIGYHNDEPGVVASIEKPVIVFANHTCYQRLMLFSFSAIQNVLPFYPAEEKFRNIFWLHFATKDLISFNDYKGHWPEFMQKRLVVPTVEIADKFTEMIKPDVILSYQLELANQNLRKTRDLLLPKLVTGEIRV